MRRSIVSLLRLSVLAFVAAAAMSEPQDSKVPDREPVHYMIIVTGSELLNGTYADQHTHFLTRTLAPLEGRCVGSMSVGDHARDLGDALEFAKGHAALTIVTGGLGPTDDDITRVQISDHTGIPLREHPALRDRLAGGAGRTVRENMRPLARVPERGTYLPNPNGTAVGLVFDDGERVTVALPGPPRELRPMVNGHLIPYLRQRFGLRSIGSSIRLRFAGIGESTLSQIIRDRVTLPEDVILTSLFDLNRVDLTFSLPGNTGDDSARLAKVKRDLAAHVGDYLYSDDDSSLEDKVLWLLQERRLKLIVAEIETGGAVTAALTAVSRSERAFSRGFVGTDHRSVIRMMGNQAPSPPERSVGKESALNLARAACALSGETAWSLTVSALEHHPERRVWVAAGSVAAGFQARPFRLGTRPSSRDRLVTSVLDFLRRRLSPLPAPSPGRKPSREPSRQVIPITLLLGC